MLTKFGPEAQEGDYVLVIDASYMHRTAKSYIAKVFKNVAYTGHSFKERSGKIRYIHKWSAEVVIPADIVPDEIKQMIEEDIKIHTKGE
jgi:ribosomal protein L13